MKCPSSTKARDGRRSAPPTVPCVSVANFSAAVPRLLSHVTPVITRRHHAYKLQRWSTLIVEFSRRRCCTGAVQSVQDVHRSSRQRGRDNRQRLHHHRQPGQGECKHGKAVDAGRNAVPFLDVIWFQSSRQCLLNMRSPSKTATVVT